ncbi:hypothetical protein PE067_16435 [Paracoccus sp. DMF-8]|uniref:hypothetical protein n=1 Tax=Paracoccus sp. DMF-8 TaxID=3019445 RepID=UPI0023E3CE80|nr:hypothetical protein [Paracoccus sp. DMF-8]MDF3607593.1 hypothetical protein [Paracoccus sp. DMF-8]
MPQSPFYAAYADRPVGEWPLMNKARLMHHFSEINTRNLPRDTALAVALQAEESRDFTPCWASWPWGFRPAHRASAGCF